MRGRPVQFNNFSKGLNTSDDVYVVAAGECRDALNVVSNTRGSIQRRNGNVTHGSVTTGTNGYPTSLFGFETSVSSNPVKWLIGAADTKIYRWDSAGNRNDLRTGSTALSTWNFEMFPGSSTPGAPGYLFGMNGTDSPFYWNGNSASSSTTWTATTGSVPNGKYVVQWQGRLWVAGVQGTDSRLYYSDLADAFSWTSTNTADFDSADGEAITGLGTVGPYLLVFKRSKVWVVYDVDTTLGPLTRVVSRNIGCCSHRTIVETPKGTMFLSPDKGVWITNGSTVQSLVTKVNPSFVLNNSLEGNATAAYWNNHYYVTFASSKATLLNDTMMDYDLMLESWWKHSCAMQDLAVWRPSTSSQTYLYGARAAANGTATAPGVDRMFDSTTYTDNASTTPYVSYWHSPWHAFEVPHVKKRLRRMTFDGSGSFSAYLATDFGSQWTPYGSVSLSVVSGDNFGQSSYVFGSEPYVFGGTSTGTPGRIYAIGGDVSNAKTGVGRTLSIRFESSSTTGMTINSYTMAVGFRKN